VLSNGSVSDPQQLEKTRASIKAGLARETLRTGDVPQGMRLLEDITDKAVISQCAVILENLKQLLEAAVLYERAESYDKAAELYIKCKLLFVNALLGH
jgi:WD repeat-containing protein 19